MEKSTLIKERDAKNIVGTYARYDVCIEKGKGATCYSKEGMEYIDFTSGIGVNSLGFCDELFVNKVTKQLNKLQHCSNLFYTSPCGELAEMLAVRTGMSKVFFANSGAEANECAIKAARKYGNTNYGKNKIVTLKNSFHGRTMATLTATGQEHYHKYFDPFLAGFAYGEANNIQSLEAAMGDDACAVILEMIQGEGGVIPLEKEFVNAAVKLCKEKNAVLIVDEVQTGIGRTGKLFAYEHFGINPDIVTFAKGIGNGLPIGGTLFSKKYDSVLEAGDHGTTFGGNPVTCSGGIAVMERIDDKFLEDVEAKGNYIKEKLKNMKLVSGVTGMGLMIGVEVKDILAKDAVNMAAKEGLLILTAKDKIRLLPPLTITKEEIDKGLWVLEKILN